VSKRHPDILVVEDDAIIRKYIVMVLPSAGARCVAEADTALDAVRLAADMRPDLVLMDVKLRGKEDGIFAARKIVEDMQIPVVLMSAYDYHELSTHGNVPAIAGFLAKPVTLEMIKDAISTFAGA